jgi:phosphoglycolate phosphatase-like HAD superfamily hydrolase
MRRKINSVVFDLDSTLADTRPRHHLLPRNNPEASWEDYAAACSLDEPIPGTIRAARLHWQQAEVHIVSERAASALEDTQKWLARHDVLFDCVSLRPEGQPSDGSGVITYIKALRQVSQVLLAYQDWPPLAERITEETGVPCVVVNPVYRFAYSEGCLCAACMGASPP